MHVRPEGLRGRTPGGLIGMVVLIVTLEHWLASRSAEFTADTLSIDWRATGRAASGREVARSEILCFGDSLVKLGVYPRILEGALGRPAYNLALAAGPPPASYVLLRRALDAGARPKAILLDTHAMILPCHPGMSRGGWPALLTARELLELSVVGRDIRFSTRTALAMALPSIRHREGIRAKTLASLRGAAWPREGLHSGLLRNLAINRGVLLPPPDWRGTPADPGATAGAHGPSRTPGGREWSAHRTNAAYLRRFLDLAAARGITVFWLLPPTSPAHLARTERRGIDARFAAFVRATQARSRNVVVIDGRRAAYRGGEFLDRTHLNRQGASAYSEAVANVIGPYLAGAGVPPSRAWVELPPYRARADELPFEDFEQSIAAASSSRPALR